MKCVSGKHAAGVSGRHTMTAIALVLSAIAIPAYADDLVVAVQCKLYHVSPQLSRRSDDANSFHNG